MKILLGGTPVQNAPPAAVTIGNFDGAALGHRHILQRLKSEAAARGLQSTAVVFEPQPAEFFARLRGSEPPPRLTPLRDKLRLLHESGCVDNVRVLRFNRAFSQMPAEDFIEHILQRELNTRYLLVGDDFRFGRDRAGSFDLLQNHSGFVTERTPSILVAGIRASSTAVRQALREGRLKEAEQILGHGCVLSGRVAHGRKLGRTIGSPTANIHLPPHRYALNGVFVVEASGTFGNGAAWPVSASIPPSAIRADKSWKSTCSTFRATSTASGCLSVSCTNCAMKKNSAIWNNSGGRSPQTSGRPKAGSPPDKCEKL